MDYNARFYSPTLGRFTQPDSIVPDMTNTQAWNRYSYVNNSPIMYVDPSGHELIIPREKDCAIDGMCTDTGTGGQVGILHDLPVSEDVLEGIQPFGATNFAYTTSLYDYCGRFHCGIDFFAEWGTPFQAGVYGRVVSYYYSDCSDDGSCTTYFCNSNGCNPTNQVPFEGPYNIIIQSGDYTIKYGHTNGDKPPVEVGDWVNPNTIIGYVGNMTGNSSSGNNHIHFEVRSPSWQGRSINPTTIMPLSVNNAYNNYLRTQEDYIAAQYYDPSMNTFSRLPAQAWQAPNAITRVNDDTSYWPH